MKIIIPVAGAGTRLRPHTLSRPKPLLTVAGKPILAHIIDPLLALDPSEIILVIGHMGDQIAEWATARYKVPVRFVVQDRLHGLGYAIHLGMSHVESGPMLIVLGDTIAQCDLKAFVSAGQNVLGLRAVDDPRRFGIAETANGKINRLIEKPEHPTSNLAIIGLYSFADARLLNSILGSHVQSDKRTRGEIQLTDALQRMLEDGEQITPFEVSNWFDCGKKETMLETNRVLLDGVANATSGSGARIMPPVWVGKGVEMQNAKIGPYVTIDDYAKITGSTISNSVIGRRSVVDGAVVRDSLVGDEARIIGNADGKELVLNIGDYSEVADAVSV